MKKYTKEDLKNDFINGIILLFIIIVALIVIGYINKIYNLSQYS